MDENYSDTDYIPLIIEQNMKLFMEIFEYRLRLYLFAKQHLNWSMETQILKIGDNHFEIVQSPYIPQNEAWFGRINKELSFDINKFIETTTFDIKGKIINVG